MDKIDTGHILDAAPPGPRIVFDMFRISVLEINDDGLVATDIIHNTVSVEGASDSMDPPLSFDTMSGFVTRFDDISDGNNNMSIFEYFHVLQHFPLITPPPPTTHIYDERSRLIDLLKSYVDVFAWSYEDILSLDSSIVQHHLPILPHARPVK